jgi:hypothetical protein
MTTEFKIFYDNQPATDEQLGEIDQIVVEQEVGRVWEARIKIPVCVTDTGTWESEDVSTNQEFTRVRIEIRKNENDFVPLIDGRIVGQDAERTSIPGKSTITLVVHDDSALLHQQDEIQSYDAETDSAIAEEIFDAAGLESDVEETPARPDNPAAAIVQRGTKMQILRSLAARHHDFYAYVLPGESSGESIGCFKKLPTEPDETIPKLEMFGEDSNLAEFNIRQNARSSSEVTAATMSLRDKSVTTSTSSYRDATLLSDEVSTDVGEPNLTTRRLPPGQNDSVDLDSATAGAAATSGYSLEADGSVLHLCYDGILTPYRVVPVRLSDSRYSTNYVIFKVVHTITWSDHTQSFKVKGNAVSAAASGGAGLPGASAGLSASFNLQINIF